MIKRILQTLLPVLLILTLVGGPVLAKSPDNTAQGPVFQELRDAIDEAVAEMTLLIGNVQVGLEQLVDDSISAIQDLIAGIQDQLDDLQTQLGAEETARIAADNNLQSQMDNIELTPGPLGPVGPVGPAGPSGAFGDYQSRQINVRYKAASDGMVIASLSKSPSGGTNWIIGDIWAPEWRVIARDIGTHAASITFPVKKGTTWQVRANSNPGVTTSVTWMPMGN